MDQPQSTKPEHTNQTRTKKRQPWLIALLICLAVLMFLAVVYGAITAMAFLGLKQAGSYLNGAPITVSDETVEARARSDVRWILERDYDAFDKDLSLTAEEQAAYRADLDLLQPAGECVLTTTRITKGQGGFDGGASIGYTGDVSCGSATAYEMTIKYSGTALSRKDAANIGRFTLNEVTLSSTNQDVLRSFLQRSGRSITADIISMQSNQQQTTSQRDRYTYATLDEYNTAILSGDLRDCTAQTPLTYKLGFRWARALPQDVGSYISSPDYRCK